MSAPPPPPPPEFGGQKGLVAAWKSSQSWPKLWRVAEMGKGGKSKGGKGKGDKGGKGKGGQQAL